MTPPARAPLRGLFVTGTDTGVGKTSVSIALLRLAHQAHLPLLPFKPVETGCTGRPPSDATRLRAASGRTDVPLSAVCPYTFDPPVAPAAAAAAMGTSLRLGSLVAAARALAARGDALLVEGAGGLLSPYGPGFTAADLAAALALPILLVARNGLGTINHTALCLAEIRRRRLPCAGVILVDTTASVSPDRATNADLIASLTGTRPLATLGHVKRATPDKLARALAASMNTGALLRRLLQSKRRRISSAALAARSRRASSEK
jgi:dethiobiotin synthetase